MHADQPAKTNKAPDTQQAVDLLAELEDRLRRLQQWQADNEEHVRGLAEEARELAIRGSKLERQGHLLQQRRQRLRRLLRALRQGRNELALQRQEMLEHLAAARRMLQDQRHQNKPQSSAENRAEKERIKAAQTEITRRRNRLHLYLKLLRERTAALRSIQNKCASLRQQYEGLLQQRQGLLEVKQFLASSEEEMTRRWAMQRSATLVVTGVIAVCLLALVSFVLGQNLAQPTWRATAVLEAAGPFAADESTQIRAALLQDAALQETFGQLTQRGLRPFDDIHALHDALQKSLRVSQTTPHAVQLILEDTNRETVVTILEALTRGFLAQQMVNDHQAQRANTWRIEEAAARQADPVKDTRWELSAGIFTLFCLPALLLAGFSYWRLRRTPRVLQHAGLPSLRTFEDDQYWPAPAPRLPEMQQD